MTSDEFERFVAWSHQAPFSDLLRVPEDEYLCIAICSRLLRDAPDVWCEPITEIKLIGGAIGTIGDGGFEALHEDGIPADRDYSKTVAALRQIGAVAAAETFSAAIRLISSGESTELRSLSFKWVDEANTVNRCLARYIRINADRLLSLAKSINLS